MSDPMFSIITATYNAATALADCLESVRSQMGTGTCVASPPAEQLLIDGGSTDGTLEIARQYPRKSTGSVLQDANLGRWVRFARLQAWSEQTVRPRRRKNLNLRADYNEPCQRLLNSIKPGSYIRPHREDDS